MSAIRFLLVSCLLCLPLSVWANSLDPSAPPTPDTLATHLARLATAEAAQAVTTHSGAEHTPHQIRAEQLISFYAARANALAWRAPGRLSALITELEFLADDGLQPEDYAIEPLLASLAVGEAAPDRAALDDDDVCTDILATRAYLQALADLRYGKLDLSRLDGVWHNHNTAPRPDLDHLVRLGTEGLEDIRTTFAHARPDDSRYRALREAYIKLRDDPSQADWQALPEGPSIRPGERSERVPMIRKRLVDLGLLQAADTVTSDGESLADDAFVAAVVAFQGEQQLTQDGIVGRMTLAALNRSPAQQRDQLRVNLERLRWLSQALVAAGPEHVLVDVAGARLSYVRDSKLLFESRTQVGRASRPTPLLRSEITHFTLNPTWTIPPTILRNDKLPEIRADLSYLERNRIRVLDSDGTELAPELVDWEAPGNILLRQDAGPGNALGRVAIRFPNPYSVYLHDTPSQRLFERDQRAFSSGCVRVEAAVDLMSTLLASAGESSPEEAATLLERGRTRQVRLSRPIPILMAYWTADVADNGRPVLRNDLYSRDAAVLRALLAPRPLPGC